VENIFIELFYLVILSWMRLNVNMCWWWLYLLCAHMLMVINYVECIYVVGGDYICNLHICCWYFSFMLLVMNMLVQAWMGICWFGLVKFAWSMFCCGRVLVHTRCCCYCCCCCLSSPIVVVEYFGIHYAGCYAGCYDVFISIRGDGLRDERVGTTHIRVV